MGASEILQTLKQGDKLTSAEIAERIQCSVASVKHGVKRLLKDVSENLEFRKLTAEEKQEKYGHKIGCRVYLYWLNE